MPNLVKNKKDKSKCDFHDGNQKKLIYKLLWFLMISLIFCHRLGKIMIQTKIIEVRKKLIKKAFQNY